MFNATIKSGDGSKTCWKLLALAGLPTLSQVLCLHCCSVPWLVEFFSLVSSIQSHMRSFLCVCACCVCVFVLLPGLGWSRQHPYCPWAETPPNHIHMWWIKHDIEIVPGLSAAGQFCWPVSESHRQVRTNLGHCKPIWKRHVSIYRGWVNQQVQNDPAWVPRLPQLREI